MRSSWNTNTVCLYHSLRGIRGIMSTATSRLGFVYYCSKSRRRSLLPRKCEKNNVSCVFIQSTDVTTSIQKAGEFKYVHIHITKTHSTRPRICKTCQISTGHSFVKNVDMKRCCVFLIRSSFNVFWHGLLSFSCEIFNPEGFFHDWIGALQI